MRSIRHRRKLHQRRRRLTASFSHAAAAGLEGDGRLPLAGIKILDLTRVLAGPYCTQILGDLGAEVIKIEHPVRGDDTRAWGAPWASYTEESGRTGHGESAYFLAVNRNKKSLGVDFKSPTGIKLLHGLARQADVLVENFVPGTLAKYGLDYETIHRLNPRLVYASVTGYGQTGPCSSRAGYDVMVEAEFGLMHLTGSRGGEPVKVGVAVTDLTTGLYCANAVQAALWSRLRTGRGQHLDVALSDCQVATLANIASSCLISGKPDSGRWGTAHPSIVPYQAFKTSDGSILLGGGNDRLFGVMCERLERASWAQDPRFKTNADRVANRTVLEPMIEGVTVLKTTEQWLEIMEGSGMPYAAVNDVQATLDHDHVRARNLIHTVNHPACGPLRLITHPVKYSHATPGIRAPPPTLGQHTDEVLESWLGLGGDEVGKLRADGVVN